MGSSASSLLADCLCGDAAGHGEKKFSPSMKACCSCAKWRTSRAHNHGIDGRMLQDGKPFLPVGVYLGFRKPRTPNVAARRDAGFNSVEMLWNNVNFAGKRTRRETLVEGVRNWRNTT